MQYCLSFEDGIYRLFGSAEVKALVMGRVLNHLGLSHSLDDARLPSAESTRCHP